MTNSPTGAGIWATSSKRSSAMFNPATAAMGAGAHPFLQHRFSTSRPTAQAKEAAQASEQGNPATSSAPLPGRTPLGAVQGNVDANLLAKKAAGNALFSPKKVRATDRRPPSPLRASGLGSMPG